MKKYIYLEGYHAEGVWEYLYVITLIAKDQLNLNANVIIILTSRHLSVSKKVRDYFHKLDKRIEFVFLKDYFYNPRTLLLSLVNFVKLVFSWSKLLYFQIDSVRIGDLIYDSILVNLGDTFTINKLETKYLRYVYVAMLEYYSYKTILKKFVPEKLFCSHLVYTRFGILSRYADSTSAEIFHTMPNKIRVISKNTFNLTETQIFNSYNIVSLLTDGGMINDSKNYFVKRINGKIFEKDVQTSFSDKVFLNKKELDNLFEVDSDKSIVLVASHVLSDATHTSSLILFKDYYEWLNFTLTRLQSNNSIIVLVKEHPSAYLYGEKNVIKELVNKKFSNINSNIKFVPNEINTKSLINYVDVTITVSGTIGIEFACNNVPSIILGSPYYKNNGFTIEPNSLSDYVKIISNISKIPRLNNIQKNLALILFKNYNRSEVLLSEVFTKIKSLTTEFDFEFESIVDLLENYLFNLNASEIELQKYIDSFQVQFNNIIQF